MGGEHLNWGLPLIIDLFAAGMGAGAYMIAVLADLIGKKKQYQDVSLAGAFIAPWPAIIGVLLLVVDLGNPLRFWEMVLKRGDGLLTLEFPFVQFLPASVMSWGTWVLSLFIITSLVYFALHIASMALHWVKPIRKIVGAIGLLFALPVTVYTGVLIASCANSLWNSFMLPTLFVSSAIATGIAAIIFLLSAIQLVLKTEPREPNLMKLEKTQSAVLIVQLAVIIIYVLTVIKSAAMHAILGYQFGLLFWFGIIGLGMIVPIITGLKKQRLSSQYSFLVSALVLLGGFFIRYVILVAGQTVA